MALAETPALFLADFGQAGALAGADVTVMFDTDTIDADGVLTQQPSVLLTSAQAPSAAAGQAVVTGGVTYTVRQVLREPPDGVFTRLVLARV
jgi:hypothetical protein